MKINSFRRVDLYWAQIIRTIHQRDSLRVRLLRIQILKASPTCSNFKVLNVFKWTPKSSLTSTLLPITTFNHLLQNKLASPQRSININNLLWIKAWSSRADSQGCNKELIQTPKTCRHKANCLRINKTLYISIWEIVNLIQGLCLKTNFDGNKIMQLLK